jgi:membrane fusion protein
MTTTLMTTNSDKDNSQQNAAKTTLFRKEALEHKKGSRLGKTIIAAPISFSVWTCGIFLIAFSIGLFLYFGKYSRRQAVQGTLVPDKGILYIYARKPGIVIETFVVQDEQVQKGQLLYLISTEQETLSDKSLSVQHVELLEKQIEVQKNRVTSFEQNIERYKKLLKQNFISEENYQKHYDEYLTAKLELQRLENSLTQAKGETDYAIKAPSSGIVSALIADKGSRVTENKPLAALIPQDSQLQGQLFVPSHAIGFIKPGQKVLLKYRAYPYQRFGLYESTVIGIDKSILLPQDISLPIALDEPFYRVTVKLTKQTVTVYGKPYSLTAGMLLDAAILGEKRNLWQWIMDPVYSLKGNLKS